MEQTLQKVVDVERGRLTVDVYGEPDGAAIVLIPGVMADAQDWSAVARHLTSWPTIAVVNRRGRQPSSPLPTGYDLDTEIRDARTVLRAFGDVRTLFGWSYGGLIALHVAAEQTVPHLIAYEPVVPPFGAAALPDLGRAEAAADLDRTVEVALTRVAGTPDEVVRSFRADAALWSHLRDVATPIHRETTALNEAPVPAEFAPRADRIDLILGERNRGTAPYGTAFDEVLRRTPRATVHVLDGQAHLAHLEAPQALAALVDDLAAAPTS